MVSFYITTGITLVFNNRNNYHWSCPLLILGLNTFVLIGRPYPIYMHFLCGTTPLYGYINPFYSQYFIWTDILRA